MKLLLPLLILLSGCGTSLYGEAGLDRLVGDAPPSQDLAWELRWVLPDEGGVRVGCSLESTTALPEQESLPFGFLEVDSPTQVDPAAWIDLKGARYAVGLPTLLDREAFVGRATADSPFAGVWGISAYQAYLVVEGDADRVIDALDLQTEEPTGGLSVGTHLVDLWADAVLDTGTLAGSIFLFEDLVALGEDVDDGPIALVGLSEATDSEHQVWSGEALGGFEGCP
jgi:hypothetical protein